MCIYRISYTRLSYSITTECQQQSLQYRGLPPTVISYVNQQIRKHILRNNVINEPAVLYEVLKN